MNIEISTKTYQTILSSLDWFINDKLETGTVDKSEALLLAEEARLVLRKFKLATCKVPE